MKIHASILVLVVLALAACGPTRPPPDLLGGARQDLATARSNGGSTYAPLELRFAEERLDQARVAMQERDYTLAANLAEESAANSDLATLKAKLGKLRESIDTLKQENAEINRVLSAGDDSNGASQ